MIWPIVCRGFSEPSLSDPSTGQVSLAGVDKAHATTGQGPEVLLHSLVRQLKSDGIGIFLVSHDIHDVFDLSDRICIMYHGRVVDTVKPGDVTSDEVLGMIILGKRPGEATAEELAQIQAAPAA